MAMRIHFQLPTNGRCLTGTAVRGSRQRIKPNIRERGEEDAKEKRDRSKERKEDTTALI